ncbi:hypothetical protein [Mucilaginibacter humi]|nr:hypothetical protein [Mucilaginibacter humi]
MITVSPPDRTIKGTDFCRFAFHNVLIKVIDTTNLQADYQSDDV